MDQPVDHDAEVERTLVVERHRVRRRVTGRFWLAAVLLPVALTALTGMTQRAAIEDALHHEASAALSARGLETVRVVVDGRSLLAEVPTGRKPEAVEKVLGTVTGAASVTTTAVYATAAEARVCGNLQKRLDRATRGQRILFAGSSTRITDAGRARVREVGRLLRICRSAVVVVGGHTDSHTYHGSDISLARARLVIGLLKEQGISSNRLQPRGYADQFPLAEGDGAAARAQNQRGSIAVTGQ